MMDAPTQIGTAPAEGEQPAEEGPTAALTITFYPDGTMRTHGENVRANHAWAASGLLRLMGDNLFMADQQRQAAMRQRIVPASGIPGGMPIPGGPGPRG